MKIQISEKYKNTFKINGELYAVGDLNRVVFADMIEIHTDTSSRRFFGRLSDFADSAGQNFGTLQELEEYIIDNCFGCCSSEGGQVAERAKYETETVEVTSQGPAVMVLQHMPIIGSLLVAKNGLTQMQGEDYSISGTMVTMLYAQKPGDRLIIHYAYN